MSAKHKRTATKSFGVSERAGHDSTRFYAGQMYVGIIKALRAQPNPRPTEAEEAEWRRVREREGVTV